MYRSVGFGSPFKLQEATEENKIRIYRHDIFMTFLFLGLFWGGKSNL